MIKTVSKSKLQSESKSKVTEKPVNIQLRTRKKVVSRNSSRRPSSNSIKMNSKPNVAAKSSEKETVKIVKEKIGESLPSNSMNRTQELTTKLASGSSKVTVAARMSFVDNLEDASTIFGRKLPEFLQSHNQISFAVEDSTKVAGSHKSSDDSSSRNDPMKSADGTFTKSAKTNSKTLSENDFKSNLTKTSTNTHKPSLTERSATGSVVKHSESAPKNFPVNKTKKKSKSGSKKLSDKALKGRIESIHEGMSKNSVNFSQSLERRLLDISQSQKPSATLSKTDLETMSEMLLRGLAKALSTNASEKKARKKLSKKKSSKRSSVDRF